MNEISRTWRTSPPHMDLQARLAALGAQIVVCVDTPRTLYRDYETRSHLNLRECGASVYAAHPSTDVWCCGYVVDDGPGKLWIPGDPTPPEFIDAASNPAWTLSAFNAAFEIAIEQHIMGPRYGWPLVPLERQRCTQAQVLAVALPANLGKAAEALGLENRKGDDRLMLQMARPRRARKVEDANIIHWYDDLECRLRLYEYCKQDVAVERELSRKAPPLPPEEQAVWLLDQKINDRGFCVDTALLRRALQMMEAAGPRIDAELRGITSGVVSSVHQPDRLLTWLREHGCDLPNIQQETVEAALRRTDLEPVVQRALALREEGAQAAAAKLTRFWHWRCADGRVRGALRYHAASTGRWSGRGPQIQNLKRAGDLGPVVDAILREEPQRLSALGDIGRAVICAAPGHRFISADFSGIESRLTAWASREQSKIDQWAQFDSTKDPKDEPYYLTGKAMGLPEDTARGIGKIADLAFGYAGGVGAWRKMAGKDTSTDDEVKEKQRSWRNLHPKVVRLWHALDRAAVAAVEAPGKVLWVDGRTGFKQDGGFLWLRLPSGRKIAYPGAQLTTTDRGERAVVFMDNSGGWRQFRGGRGAYLATWIQNLVQATARDLLAAAMLRLDGAGYSIVMHVHDEVVAEVPDGFGSEEEFLRLLTTLPDWAEGLPVAAKVRSGHRFSK